MITLLCDFSYIPVIIHILKVFFNHFVNHAFTLFAFFLLFFSDAGRVFWLFGSFPIPEGYFDYSVLFCYRKVLGEGDRGPRNSERTPPPQEPSGNGNESNSQNTLPVTETKRIAKTLLGREKEKINKNNNQRNRKIEKHVVKEFEIFAQST